MIWKSRTAPLSLFFFSNWSWLCGCAEFKLHGLKLSFTGWKMTYGNFLLKMADKGAEILLYRLKFCLLIDAAFYLFQLKIAFLKKSLHFRCEAEKSLLTPLMVNKEAETLLYQLKFCLLFDGCISSFSAENYLLRKSLHFRCEAEISLFANTIDAENFLLGWRAAYRQCLKQADFA